jgi:predicted kinase
MREKVKMATLYMLVGMPCSGKTHFREQYFDNEFHVLSTDRHIDRIAKLFDKSYNFCFKESIKLAEKIMYKDLDDIISWSKTDHYYRQHVVWDQTNLTAKTRMKKLAPFKEVGYRTVAYVFPLPEEKELERRLIRREQEGKVIPLDVWENMKNSFVYPTLEEGFDEIRDYHGGI